MSQHKPSPVHAEGAADREHLVAHLIEWHVGVYPSDDATADALLAQHRDLHRQVAEHRDDFEGVVHMEGVKFSPRQLRSHLIDRHHIVPEGWTGMWDLHDLEHAEAPEERNRVLARAAANRAKIAAAERSDPLFRMTLALWLLRLLIAVVAGAGVGWFISGPLNLPEGWPRSFFLWWGLTGVGIYILIGRRRH